MMLEQRFAIRLLLAIAENEGQSQIDLCGNSKTKVKRLAELESVGLVRCVRLGQGLPTRTYLTDKGRKVAPHLRAVAEVMG